MSGQQPTAAQQEQYLNQVRQQVQQQVMQDIMTKMTEKCFKVNGEEIFYSSCMIIRLFQFLIFSSFLF